MVDFLEEGVWSWIAGKERSKGKRKRKALKPRERKSLREVSEAENMWHGQEARKGLSLTKIHNREGQERTEGKEIDREALQVRLEFDCDVQQQHGMVLKDLKCESRDSGFSSGLATISSTINLSLLICKIMTLNMRICKVLCNAKTLQYK